MPYAIGLHVLVALFFAHHATTTNQDKYWLFILFAFPLLGSVIYGVAIFLPALRHTHEGQVVLRGARRLLDPTRELRAAQDALEVAATAGNRLRLADALLDAGRASEAVVQYQAVLVGVHSDDERVRVRLAHALVEAGQAAAARAELDALIAANPQFKSPEGHLTYARALVALDERAKAREEFEVLVGYIAGLEARARYAEALLAWGDGARLRDLLADSNRISKRMPRAAREINREWIERLQAVEKAVGPGLPA